MNAIGFLLLVNTCYFLADVFLKIGSLKLSAGRLVYIRSLFTLTLAAIWLMVSGEMGKFPTSSEFIWFLFCSLLCALGLYYYIRALQHMHFVNVAVIGIAGAFIHYLLGIFLNHETVNAWFYPALLLSVGGIVLQWKKSADRRGLKEALISSIAWGFGYALLSIPLKTGSASWGTFIMEGTTLVMSAFFLILSDPEFTLLRPNLNRPALIAAAMFTITGSVLLNLSYKYFTLNTMGFMQLSFFPYSLLAGYFLFRERLNKWEWIGNGLVFAGLVIYFFWVG